MQKFPYSQLLTWHKTHGRHDLPWRDYSFPEKELGYRVWLAEIMLQQTQVNRVKEYFHNILQAFPSVEALAGCEYEDFFPYYKGLGYYSRARNMLKAARQVRDEFGGVFPKDARELRSLAGVGPYTAEAIRAFAYDIPTLSFDTNLEKIFSRYYHGNKFHKLSKEEKCHILEDFRESGISARDINNTLMDYGATISLNNLSGISWEDYPIQSSKFYQTRGSLEPIKEKKISRFPSAQALVFCVLHESHKKYFSLPVISADADISGQDATHSNHEPNIERHFSPFYIGKGTRNPRALIQEYFLKKYKLELSVRPPEIKSYLPDGTPYMLCYAQVQSGTHEFQVFENLKVRGFEEGYVENSYQNT